MVGAAVVAGVGVVVGGSVGAEVEASSGSMQVAVHSAPAPPLLLLLDRNCTLRVRPFTVTSGELSSQNLEFVSYIRRTFQEFSLGQLRLAFFSTCFLDPSVKT